MVVGRTVFLYTMCPVCKTENGQNAKFCQECGIRLELQCPYCHAPSAVGAKFCAECGSNLDFRCLQCGSVSRPGSKFCQQCGVHLITLCFTCQTPTPPGARFCQECGERLERRCAECGAPILYGARFCNGCGVGLQVLGTEAAPRPAATIVPVRSPVRPVPPPHFAPEPVIAEQTVVAEPPRQRATAPETTAPTERVMEHDPPVVEAPPRDTGSLTLQDERRLVTVLFGDVSGFTAMSEKLDPEEVKLIMDRCLKVLADQVNKFEGTVDKFEGDLIMAVWGAPTAHEDDAERAVLAAIDMQAELATFAVDLQRRRGFDLKMRIGLNTGEAISGAVGAGREKDYTVMGDVVNTASRLEGAARPGHIMVGEKTYGLTKHLIDYDILEPIEVKGKSEPIPVFEVIGVKEGRERRRGVVGLESPIVGRSSELQVMLQHFYDVAESKVPHLVTVSGAPGLGKSRLLDEFQRYLEDVNATFTWSKGRCLPYGQGIAFNPFSEMLKGFLTIKESDSKEYVQQRLLEGTQELVDKALHDTLPPVQRLQEARQIAHRLGYTMGIMFPDCDLLSINPANIKDELHWGWRRFLTCWGSTRPLIIQVEDIHWADQVVLELLQSVLTSLEGVPILFICLTRPELLEEFPDWLEGERRAFVQLDPLAKEETIELMDNLLSPNILSHSWKERVAVSSGGVPYYLEEYLRTLIEDGELVRGSAGWSPADSEHLPELPDTVYATISARIDKLPVLEKAVLQRAAVVGGTFWSSALAYPAERLDQEEALLAMLLSKHWFEEARESSFVEDRQFRFINELARESAYRGLTRRARSKEHERTAEWLEQKVAGREEEFIELLAYHYGQATLQEFADDDVDVNAIAKAASYGWRAGERSFTHRSFVDALSRYDDTLALLSRLSELYPAGNFQVAEKDLPEVQTDVLLHRAMVKESLGRYDSALEDIDLADALASIRAAVEAGSLANMQKARVLRLKGQITDAVACAERAIELYEDKVDALLKAQTLLMLGELYSDQAKFPEFEQVSREAREIARSGCPRWVEARSLTLIGTACVYQGKMADALHHLDEAVDIYEELNDHRGLAQSLLILGRVLHANGQAADAIAHIERAFHVFDELGDSPMRAAALATLAQLSLERGNLLAARLYADQGAVLSQGLGQVGQQMRCLLILGQVCIAENDADTAVARLLEAKAICEEADQRAILPEIYRTLAQAYVAQGQAQLGFESAMKGREAVEEDDHYSQGTTWMGLAGALAALGQGEKAEEAFVHAQEALEEAGEPYEIGEIHLAYSVFLQSHGRVTEAVEHLALAKESFSSLATRDKLERIAQLEQEFSVSTPTT